MLIGAHAVPAFKKNPTGVELYAREIITRMIASVGGKAEFRLYTDYDPCGDEGARDPLCSADIRVLRAPFLWTQGRLSLEMVLHKPDVLFVPGNALPRVLPKRTVTMLHGAEFMQAPQHYAPSAKAYLESLTKDTLRRADAVLVPSYATASALAEYFGADEEKLHVVHHGAPKPPASDPQPPTPSPKPYFLYIGRLETHKNVHGLVEAFSAFKRARPEGGHELVLAGSPGFGYDIILAAIEQSDYKEVISLPGYVAEDEKWSLLRGALAFCYPSFAEGFGLPVLEAQAAGTPLLTSNMTAMPEVAGATGALLVNPHDSEQMSLAMERISDDADLRATLIRHGKENLSRFSWNKAAKTTLDILFG